jgi:hypothetical protein
MNNQATLSYKLVPDEEADDLGNDEYSQYSEIVFIIESFPIKSHFTIDLTQNFEKVKNDIKYLINDLNENERGGVYFNDSGNSSQSINYAEEIICFEMTNNNSQVWGDIHIKFPYSKTEFISLLKEIETKLN